MNKLHIVLLSALIAPVGAMGADLDLELGGFIWADVGTGDRYDGSDDDQTGISKAAVTVSTSVDNVTAGMTLGVDGMINEPLGSNGSAANDDVEVKEAWIAFDFDLADVTIGKQALGFGLKPAGWVGGRPINDGEEFGGASGTNVSGQVVTGIAADLALPFDLGLRAAIFDAADADSDNSMADNFMLQVRSDGLFGTGIYASAGYEETANAAGDIEVSSIGVGYNFGIVDISIESQSADIGTGSDQDTTIVAASIPLNEQAGIYVDYADGETSETTRVGLNYSYNDNVDFIVEYADDEFDGGEGDVDSIDLRIALSF